MKPITHNGRPITDAEIHALSNRAAVGIDVSALKRRPGRPAIGNTAAEVFPVRLDPELRAALEQRAKSDDTTSSQVVRMALRSYLF